MSAELTDTELNRLAERLAPLLAAEIRADQATPIVDRPLVDALTIAGELGVSRQWVYLNAEMLGGQRVGTGPRSRWRFDPAAARAVYCPTGRQSGSVETGSNASAGADSASSARQSRRRRSGLPNPLPPAGSILASRPRETSR